MEGFKQKLRILTVIGALLQFMTGCGDPLDAYHQQITQFGYIPFITPLKYGATGTLVGGKTAKQLSIVAPPTTCFPEHYEDGTPTNLRFLDDSDLPYNKRTISVSLAARASFAQAMAAGTPSVNVKAGVDYVQSYQVTFSGVHVEMFDQIKLTQFYQEHMSDACKLYLDKVGFIIQALRVDSMAFSFYDQSGGAISLSVDNIQQFLDIGADVKWNVTNQFQLEIKTPKYIGYQLGMMTRTGDGLFLVRSTRTSQDHYVWGSISNLKPNLDLADSYRPHLPATALDSNQLIPAGSEVFLIPYDDLNSVSTH